MIMKIFSKSQIKNIKNMILIKLTPFVLIIKSILKY